MKLSVTVLALIAIQCLYACGGPGVVGNDSGTASDTRNTGPTDGSNAVVVVVSPAVVMLSQSGTQSFTATVTGAANNMVHWSVMEPQGGSIDDSGHYTAPSAAGRYHVVATSVAEPSRTGTASVQVSIGSASSLPIGVWTNITPPVELGNDPNNAGVVSVAVDASHPATVYIGVDYFAGDASNGIWRTTDGGANWARLGPPDDDIYDNMTTAFNSSTNIAVDPADSNHLYISIGVRGNDWGFWVSHDAGAHWTKPAGLSTTGTNGDLTAMAIDPSDFSHVLLGSHTQFPIGVVETTDGGDTWVVHRPADASWRGGSYGVHFLFDPATGRGDRNTWLVQNDAMWRTTDAGAHWTRVSEFGAPHGFTDLYYTHTGVVYSGAGGCPVRSSDNGQTWEALAGGLHCSAYSSIIGDGTSLYTMESQFSGHQNPFMTSLETDGATWTRFGNSAEVFTQGPDEMRIDTVNHIVYSANGTAGLWALRTR